MNEKFLCLGKLDKGKTFLRKKTKFFIKKLRKNYELINIIIKNLKSLAKLNVVFDPTIKIRIIWDLIIMFSLFMNFLIIPFEISFHLRFSPIKKYFVTLFIIDILIRFNTAYFDKGWLIYSRKKIFFNYILSYKFYFDILAIFPFFQIFNERNIFIDCVIFLKYYHFKKITEETEQFLLIGEKLHNYINLIKLILNIILIAHIFACIWHFIGASQIENSWIQKYKFTHDSDYKKYIYSFYFVIVTMNTVGYGILQEKI